VRLIAILERGVPTVRDQDLRVRYLDGLRGFAAFVVLLSHVSIVAFPSIFNGLPEMARLRWEWRLAGTPLDLLWAANFAVCIFFVMSALVLSAFCEKEGTNFVANSVRRYIRLTVPILAASGLAYVIYSLGGMQNLAAQKITQEGWLKLIYLKELKFGDLLRESLLQVYLTGNSYFDPPLWTMKYEMIGSLGVFALFALVPNRILRLVVLAVGAVLLWNTYYFCFVGGIFLYEWMKSPPELRARLPTQVGYFCLLAGAYMGAFPYNVARPENPWFGRMMFLGVEQWHIIGATPFVLGVILLEPVRRFFQLKPLQYLGRISFFLYLVHAPLIGSFMSIMIVALYRPPHATFAIVVAAILTIPLSLVCADLLERFVDKPAIRLSRRVGRWIAATFSPGSARRTAGVPFVPSHASNPSPSSTT
jgi:peptidoglycan/LPS O-acetylase OafA/YrhL